MCVWVEPISTADSVTGGMPFILRIHICCCSVPGAGQAVLEWMLTALSYFLLSLGHKICHCPQRLHVCLLLSKTFSELLLVLFILLDSSKPILKQTHRLWSRPRFSGRLWYCTFRSFSWSFLALEKTRKPQRKNTFHIMWTQSVGGNK